MGAAAHPTATATSVATASGRLLDLMEPAPDSICLGDLAEGLSKTARWGGHTPDAMYSAAQHSVLVARQLRGRAALYGLLHDAHEAYIGDILSPLARALTAYGGGEGLELIARGLDFAIHTACGLPWPPPPEIARAVHCADLQLLAAERRDLMGPGWDLGRALPDPEDVPTIRPLPWMAARELWLQEMTVFAAGRQDWPDLRGRLAPALTGDWGLAAIRAAGASRRCVRRPPLPAAGGRALPPPLGVAS